MKRRSLDARSEGQSGYSPKAGGRSEDLDLGCWSPVLVQRAVWEDPRWTRAVGDHLARPQGRLQWRTDARAVRG
jgi:hypothetical protein